MIRASRLSYSCGLSFSASDTCFSFSSSCTKRAIVTGAIDNLPLGSQGDQSNPWAGVGCGWLSPPGSLTRDPSGTGRVIAEEAGMAGPLARYKGPELKRSVWQLATA